MTFKAFLTTIVFTTFTASLIAAPLLTEGFETYALGGLDANYVGGPNYKTNGPWAGEYPPNLRVVNAELSPNNISVTPHGGTNMVRGSLNDDEGDQDFYNLSYWLNATNGNAPFFGNFNLDWWFFDCVGQGTNGSLPADYCDSLSLAYYSGVPSDESYSSTLTNSSPGFSGQNIIIGGTYSTGPGFDGSNELSGFDGTKYQTSDQNQNGYDDAGTLNIPSAVRSVGWHHARIQILPQRADQSVDVSIYVDNLLVPGLRFNTASPSGFNVITINANLGQTAISGYWDDISFSLLPPPTFTTAFNKTNVVLMWSNSWILQTSTNLATGWNDVVDKNTNFVNSPYTNNLTGVSAIFFRLRN